MRKKTKQIGLCLFIFAFFMQVLVFVSPILPNSLQLQETFCLKLHDVSVHSGSNHQTHDKDHHAHKDCNICVLHHLFTIDENYKSPYVKWLEAPFFTYQLSYKSVYIMRIEHEYPLKQAPPSIHSVNLI